MIGNRDYKSKNIKFFIGGKEIDHYYSVAEINSKDENSNFKLSGTFTIKNSPSVRNFLDKMRKQFRKMKYSEKLQYKKAKSQSKNWAKWKRRK
ncbi:hypothetical protein [Paenibacillus shenyangensis]|uniref:hypothetical protein n=1 Tax=Paenibacillus sp. A9 TaxID=1284352 RepID=UPI000370BB9D|nr:hypothetical protein [Paenibacillus sp. A9]